MALRPYYLCMSSCCRAQPCEEIFSWRVAEWDLRSYRRRGLEKLERKLLASVPQAVHEGSRVLEIGGGIGVLQAELLRKGAASGEVIELVAAYKPYAAELARDLEVEDRTEFRVHDVLAEPGSVERADVVILNRVICCSPEGLELVAVAATLARKALVLSFPRASWPLRVAARLQHLLFRALGRKYRFYVRPSDDVAAAATAGGLVRSGSGRGLIWEHATFVRPG